MVLVSAIFLSLLLIPIAMYTAGALKSRGRRKSIRALAAAHGWFAPDPRQTGSIFHNARSGEVSNRVVLSIRGRDAEMGDRMISVRAPRTAGILRHTSAQRTRSFLTVESPNAVHPPVRTRTPSNDVQFPRTTLRATVVQSDRRFEIRARGKRLRLREPLWSADEFEQAVELASDLIEAGLA
ncbi:MAG: hypothetical protein AAGH64_04410 [Planctomycetota bacterium]